MGRCLMLLLLTLTSFVSSAQEAYSVFTEADSTLTFYCDSLRSSRQGTLYSLVFTDSVPDWYENRGGITKVVFDTTFVDARPTSTLAWFRDMAKLDSIAGIEYLKTDSVTDMRRMFQGCMSLDSVDVSGFNTSSVTDMMSMFQECVQLKSLNLSGFNTSRVIDMEGMFYGCSSLDSLDLSGFNTSRV